MPRKTPKVQMMRSSIPVIDARTCPPPPRKAATELLTPEHKAWALAVKRRAGWRCEDCGASGVQLYADHVHERRDGGALLDLDNGRALCGSCHTRKTATARAARHGLA